MEKEAKNCTSIIYRLDLHNRLSCVSNRSGSARRDMLLGDCDQSPRCFRRCGLSTP
uniref:Uncharacterized protein n=1 Tax=Anopheles atroparvus TaxID=41427 RepID=A0AAG5CVS9_ANOAO